MYRATWVTQILTFSPGVAHARLGATADYDIKSGKRREMIARLCSNTACELGFRGASTRGNASWEQLRGSEPTNANRDVTNRATKRPTNFLKVRDSDLRTLPGPRQLWRRYHLPHRTAHRLPI